MPQFRWTYVRERAAALVAENVLSDEKIAAEVGISRAQLHRWRKTPEFAARVDELVASYAAALKARGIANIEARVDALTDRWRRMQQVITERVAAADMQQVPGGTTGLIVRQIKATGGLFADEFAVDTGLLKEMRAHEEQAAKELGQWIDKADVTTAGLALGSASESLNDQFNALTDPAEREAFIERVRAVNEAQRQLAELRRDVDVSGDAPAP